MRTCISCLQAKPESEFIMRGRGGRMYACRDCTDGYANYPTDAMRIKARRMAHMLHMQRKRATVIPAPTCEQCTSSTWTRTTNYTTVDTLWPEGRVTSAADTESPDEWVCENGHYYSGPENLSDWMNRR